MKRFKFILILLCFLCTKSIAQTITHVTLTCYQPVKSQCDIEGFGIYEVKDVMNKRHKHRIDILIHPKDSKRISIEHVKVKILK